MLFVLHALDRPDASLERAAHYAAHKAFLAEALRHGIRVLVAGPLISDGTQMAIGSLMIVEASTRADLERFHLDDPFVRAGIWSTTHIARFVPRLHEALAGDYPD